MKQRQIKAPDMPLAVLKVPSPPKPDNESPHDSSQEVEVSPPKPDNEPTHDSSQEDEAESPHLVEKAVEQPASRQEENGEDHGDWMMIPLSRLKIHPFNSRTQRTQERIEEVRDMLEAEHKQREPITVVPGRSTEDAGSYYILSGQTRYHAANLAGWAELKSQVNYEIDPDDHLAFFAASIEHNTSRPETDWDLAVKVRALIEEGTDSVLIQKAVRRDARGLRRLTAMTDLPDPVLAVVRENPTKLTATVCEVLKANIPELGEEGVTSVAKEAVLKDLSRRELEDCIELAIRQKNKVSGVAKRATRQFMLPVVIGSNKKAGEFKVMQSRNEGNRLISLTADLPDKLVETFKADIEAAIARLAGKHNET